MTLKEILDSLKKFIGDAVRSLDPSQYSKEDCETELEEIRSALSNGIEDTQKEYRRLVHKFYTAHKPFRTGDTQKDLAEYRKLLVHSLAAGDVILFSLSRSSAALDDGDRCLLDTWGVEFPHNTPDALAKGSLEYYFKMFSFLCQDQEWQHFRNKYNLPDGAKVYYEYLAKKMAIALKVTVSAQSVP
ncbi:hypothetical protein C7B65_19865 [Phormidesmis priestleyi ULC007]|uniref:Uncharacterized protein n=1 Tax=Phormidesmis priestleyi ULC007 TaxID=1920490 RepID=A0A2T1D990_9CYAN|nr:hypothetical protein [Phormidesmis priestleyi]PSB17070.1 hypothetical protein C7B65_19865 [Phormidesmis priestleyi ULC007]PZO48164.1 MAG: hypothetical protein DCF14_17675 [Phormidesmis priestleyi]